VKQCLNGRLAKHPEEDVDQWRIRLHACGEAKDRHFEHLLQSTGSFRSHLITALVTAMDILLKKTCNATCVQYTSSFQCSVDT